MAERKPAHDVSGLNRDVAKSLTHVSEEDRLIQNQGTFGSKLLEPVPHFIQVESEKVIKNENNAWIVLGRDRPANIMSGYGGRGDTQAASIDLVCGRMAAKPRSDAHMSPDFKVDAARIYISQKTDIDANFDVTEGVVGSPDYFEKPASAIALKADGIRVLSRDGGIKLVTGVDRINSQGGAIKSRTGIELIAGNDSRDLQPLVKGDSIRQSLEELSMAIADLAGIVSGLALSQTAALAVLMSHVHIAPPMGGPTTPPDPVSAGALSNVVVNIGSRTQPNLATMEANQAVFQFNYLNPQGTYYINSENNYTN